MPRINREYLFIGVLTAIAAIVRVWGFFDLGLVQFDEGVYALGLWPGSLLGELAQYADRHLQAPPLFFAVVTVAYAIFGISDHAAIAGSLVIGVATVPLARYMAQMWFGPAAGIAAAMLVAISEYHISYSRMALTDVAFGFFFLLSLVCIAKAYEEASLGWGIMAGLVVGASWNTKYHGWVTLSIACVPLAVWLLARVYGYSRMKKFGAIYVAMCAVALLSYIPWALYVQGSVEGGYVTLMKYQRTYPSRQWMDNILTQAFIQWYMDGWLSRAAPAAAFLCAVAVRSQKMAVRWGPALLISAALLACGIAFGGYAVAVLIAVLATPLLIRTHRTGNWLVIGSLAVFFVLTGLYHPYGRLLMPWMLVIFVAASFGLERLAAASSMEHATSRKATAVLAAVIFICGAAAAGAGRTSPRTWMPTSSFRTVAAALAERLPANALVLVHGDAVIPYYLRLHGHRALRIDRDINLERTVTRLGAERSEVYFISGIYSERDPKSRGTLERLRRGPLELVATFPVEPNDVRLLDDFSPDDARKFRMSPSHAYDLKLYRWRPHSTATTVAEAHRR